MEDAGPVVCAVVRRHEFGAQEIREELPRLLTKHDASERRVLAHHSHAGVPGDEDQKAGLPFGEPALGDLLNGVVEVHRSSSSMIRGSGVRRPPPFVLAVIPRPREPRRPPPPPPAAPRVPTTRAVPAL